MKKTLLLVPLLCLGLIALVATLAFAKSVPKPAMKAVAPKAAPAPVKPKMVFKAAATGSAVSVTPTFDYGNISFNPDGTVDLRVFVTLSGAARTRILHMANVAASDAGAGGLLVTLDGQTLIVGGVCQGTLAGTSACTGLTGAGGAPYLLALPTKIVALLGAPAIQPFLVAP